MAPGSSKAPVVAARGCLAFLPQEPQEAPPPVMTPQASETQFVPELPDLLEHVTRVAEKLLQPSMATPLLLHRVSTLLQDAVEAAYTCARAHIDAPLLAKHLLGNEQYQAFLAAHGEGNSTDGVLYIDRSGDTDAQAFASAVTSTVGEVRAAPRQEPQSPPPS